MLFYTIRKLIQRWTGWMWITRRERLWIEMMARDLVPLRWKVVTQDGCEADPEMVARLIRRTTASEGDNQT